MRTLTIRYNSTMKQNILFDGPLGKIDDRYRAMESPTLIELLDAIPSKLKRLNPDKPVEVYFDGYTSEERHAMEVFLTKRLPKARYPKK